MNHEEQQKRNGTGAGSHSRGYCHRLGPYLQGTDHRFRKRNFFGSAQRGFLAGARSRKGAAFVEAAVVFPVVILAICGLLTVNINLYTQVREQCTKHLESREAGESLSFSEADMVRKLVGNDLRVVPITEEAYE